MKKNFCTELLKVTAIAGFALATNAALAATNTLPDFTVKPVAPYAQFSADQMSGKYVEIANFNSDNTFSVSLYWKAGSFVNNDGKNALDADVTGLTISYGVYALYTAQGTYSTNGARTDFNFTAGTGDLTLYLDKNKNSVFTAPDLAGDFTFTGTDDDVVLATGKPLYGTGFVDPSLQTCGAAVGNYCGSFGSRTSLDLSAAGSAFFIEPTPFFNLAFESGQVNNFPPIARQVVNGSLDVSFAVPEPTSVALLGLGLFGLGLSRRRSKNA